MILMISQIIICSKIISYLSGYVYSIKLFTILMIVFEDILKIGHYNYLNCHLHHFDSMNIFILYIMRFILYTNEIHLYKSVIFNGLYIELITDYSINLHFSESNNISSFSAYQLLCILFMTSSRVSSLIWGIFALLLMNYDRYIS